MVPRGQGDNHRRIRIRCRPLQEYIVARSTMRQRQKIPQKIQLGLCKPLHVGAGLRTAEHRRKDDEQHLVQRKANRIVLPRILQFAK